MGRGGLRPARRIERPLDGPADLKDLHFVDYNRSKWHEKVRRVADKVGAAYLGTEVWSSHMRYVALIIGGGDVQVRIPPRGDRPSYVWDHAGAQLIFTEVGGKITDLEGKEMDFGAGRELRNNWGLIATNEGVHAKILQVVNEVIQEGQEKGAQS
jgi:3'(2'), 5'-bisphosphate nucleotidase